MIYIEPNNIKLFGPKKALAFCLIIPKSLRNEIVIKNSESYESVQCCYAENVEELDALLKTSELQNSDIVYIPYGQSDRRCLKPRERLNKHQRFITLSCCSTQIDLYLLKQFILLLHKSDPDDQIATANRFFDSIEQSDEIVFVDNRFNTNASLSVNDDILCTQSFGYARYGEPMLFPYGEVPISHVEFSDVHVPKLKEFNGELIFNGYIVLQRVIESKFMPDFELNRLFTNLSEIEHTNIKAKIEAGAITNLTLMNSPNSDAGKGAIAVLESLFTIDERLRTLVEIGFGLNKEVEILKGYNTILNEPYANGDICVHFGLGGLQTIVHLDIICPNTEIQFKPIQNYSNTNNQKEMAVNI